jgi:hypothetical protein
MSLGAAIGGISGAVGGVYSAIKQNKIAEQNIALQRETNAQNERLMREGWGREDTAVQRRAADLAAAGQSPLMAAGAAAQSGGPASMIAPKNEQNPGLQMQAILAGTGAVATLMDAQNKQRQADADVNLKNVQAVKSAEDTKMVSDTRKSQFHWKYGQKDAKGNNKGRWESADVWRYSSERSQRELNNLLLRRLRRDALMDEQFKTKSTESRSMYSKMRLEGNQSALIEKQKGAMIGGLMGQILNGINSITGSYGRVKGK